MPDLKALPAEACSRCNRTLAQTGGSRILLPRFWTQEEIDAAGGAIQMIRDMHDGKREMAAVQTRPGDWSDEDMRKIEQASVEARRQGLVPWVCQACMGHLCRVCKSPMLHALGVSIVDEEGHAWYSSGFVAAMMGCGNPACEKYRWER